MNVAHAIRAYVIEHPGCTSGDIANHLAETTPARALPKGNLTTMVCKRLNNMLPRGRVRRTGRRTAYLWWPTAATTAGPRKYKPTAAQQPRAVRRTPEKLTPPATPPKQVQPETVAQFLKRGGRIQYPGPADAAHPLRFDHTDTNVPARARVPNRRRHAHAL